MGFLSGVAAVRKIAKMRSGSRESLSIADITNLIINLPDAKKNLPQNQFDAVYSLYKTLQKCRTSMSMDLTGYYEEAVIIINIFNEIAPYEKYSGMEKTEALFFMDGVGALLDDMKPRSTALLKQLKTINPELNRYLATIEKDAEEQLVELATKCWTKEDDDYITYLMQNCHYLTKEHAKAFCGILATNHFYGKDQALSSMDGLFMKWINSGTIDGIVQPMNERLLDSFTEISFLCGALVPNGIVTKEESDQLSEKYTDLWIKHNVVPQNRS